MSQRKQKLNVAMIGSGFIARVHSNAFHQVGYFFKLPNDLHLKVICGRDRAKLEAAASQWGWEEVETDWRTIVGREDIQVIDIAVPNALHAPIAIAGAQAGKIVLCEKPLAMSLEEAESMARAVRHVPNLVWSLSQRDLLKKHASGRHSIIVPHTLINLVMIRRKARVGATGAPRLDPELLEICCRTLLIWRFTSTEQSRTCPP